MPFHTVLGYVLLQMASFILIKRVNFIKWFQFHLTRFIGNWLSCTFFFDWHLINSALNFQSILILCFWSVREIGGVHFWSVHEIEVCSIQFVGKSRHIEHIIIVQVFKLTLIQWKHLINVTQTLPHPILTGIVHLFLMPSQCRSALLPIKQFSIFCLFGHAIHLYVDSFLASSWNHSNWICSI